MHVEEVVAGHHLELLTQMEDKFDLALGAVAEYLLVVGDGPHQIALVLIFGRDFRLIAFSYQDTAASSL